VPAAFTVEEFNLQKLPITVPKKQWSRQMEWIYSGEHCTSEVIRQTQEEDKCNRQINYAFFSR
jgi:hypothetical protein